MSETNDGMDDLHDPRLRRALDHAPDRDAMPAAHTREAILKMAHNLAAASAPAAGRAAEAAPWWRRVFGGGGGPRSRMPWNAAFATVLVATFVTVLWQREPVPEAGLDGEAQVAGAPAPASAPPAQPAEGPAPVQAAPPAAEPAATADTTPPAVQRSEASRDAKETLKQRETQEARDASRRREAPAAASIQKDEERMREKAAPAAPVVQAPAPAIASAPVPAAPPMADVGRSPVPYAAAPPAPAPAAAAPPMQRESAETTSSLAAQGGASANVAGMQRRAAPASAAAKAAAPRAATEAATTGGFTALDRWTALDITRAGTTTRQARGDTEGLAALVNTVARAATVSGGELGAPVEARIELRRDGALLAVLEIAGDQVRWTPQPGGPASIGTPPAQALAALRTAVSRTR